MPVSARLASVTVDDEGFGPGAVVSLNLQRSSYVAVTGAFILSAVHPTARIPTEIGTDALVALRKAFERGVLVLGAEPVRQPLPIHQLRSYFDLLDKSIGLSDARPMVGKMLRDPLALRRLSPYQALQELLAHEVVSLCRDEYVNYLTAVLNSLPGPTPVTELPQDNITVAITIVPNQPSEAAPPLIAPVGRDDYF